MAQSQRKLTVDVTAQDIANGVPGKPDECPIALALCRAYPRRGGWVVDDALAGCYLMPDDAREFVRAFDAGEDVSPFVFLLGGP